MNIKHTIYSWLITAIAGSLLLVIGYSVFAESPENMEAEVWGLVILACVVVSLGASVPAFILYQVLGKALNNGSREKLVNNLVLSVYAAVATWCTLSLLAQVAGKESGGYLRNSDIPTAVWIALPYVGCFIACIWLFNSRTEEKTATVMPEGGLVSEAGVKDTFPQQVVIAIVAIILVMELWNIFNVIHFWKYYPASGKVTAPLMLVLQLTGVVLLCRRHIAGWYILSVIASSSVASNIIFAVKLCMARSGPRGLFSLNWLFFVAAAIIITLLLMQSSMRRYFSINQEKLGITIFAGVLLAVVFFFIRQ